MDKITKAKIADAAKETGFSVKGFSRRDFGMMLFICQEVLLDEELTERVDLASKFKMHELELPALGEKITDFIESNT